MVNQRAGAAGLLWDSSGAGLARGIGSLPEHVSGRVNWPLINKFANWSSPLGILLVCHDPLCCSFASDWFSQNLISEGSWKPEGAGGIHPVITHIWVNKVDSPHAKVQEWREGKKKMGREKPLSLSWGWPGQLRRHLGFGFDRKTQLYIPATQIITGPQTLYSKGIQL